MGGAFTQTVISACTSGGAVQSAGLEIARGALSNSM